MKTLLCILSFLFTATCFGQGKSKKDIETELSFERFIVGCEGNCFVKDLSEGRRLFYEKKGKFFSFKEKKKLIQNSNKKKGINQALVEKSEIDYKSFEVDTTWAKYLTNGLITAKKWAGLNKTHKKSFEKEILKFKVVKEGKVLYASIFFIGYTDGTFECRVDEMTLNNQNDLDAFLKCVDGTYERLAMQEKKEADRIFTK